MAHNHPNQEMLANYTVGGLGNAQSVVIATHLTLCGDCRETIDGFNAIGGALLTDAVEEPLSGELFESLMKRLGDEESEDTKTESVEILDGVDEETCRIIPRPLRDCLGVSISEIRWQKLGPKIEYVELDFDEPGISGRVLRLPAGVRMPSHTHSGTEMTVVLSGSFSDEFGHYERGDLAVLDHTDTHQPEVNKDGDCLCFVVTDAPLKLTGPFGFFLNRFLKW